MSKSAAMAVICAITFTSSSAFAGQILEYVATFGGISGDYRGVSFEDRTMTFTMVANTDYLALDGDQLVYEYPMVLGNGPTLINLAIDGVVNDQIGGTGLRIAASDNGLVLGVDEDNGSHTPLFILDLGPSVGGLTLLTSPGSYDPVDGYLYHNSYWQWYFTDLGGNVGGHEIQIDTWDGTMSWEVLPFNSIGNPIPGIGGVACLMACVIVRPRRR